MRTQGTCPERNVPRFKTLEGVCASARQRKIRVVEDKMEFVTERNQMSRDQFHFSDLFFKFRLPPFWGKNLVKFYVCQVILVV